MEYIYPDGEEHRDHSDSFLIKQLEQYGSNIYFIFVPRNYEKLISRWSLLLLVLWNANRRQIPIPILWHLCMYKLQVWIAL